MHANVSCKSVCLHFTRRKLMLYVAREHQMKSHKGWVTENKELHGWKERFTESSSSYTSYGRKEKVSFSHLETLAIVLYRKQERRGQIFHLRVEWQIAPQEKWSSAGLTSFQRIKWLQLVMTVVNRSTNNTSSKVISFRNNLISSEYASSVKELKILRNEQGKGWDGEKGEWLNQSCKMGTII